MSEISEFCGSIDDWTIHTLKAQLRKYKLSTKGTKGELYLRLAEAVRLHSGDGTPGFGSGVRDAGNVEDADDAPDDRVDYDQGIEQDASENQELYNEELARNVQETRRNEETMVLDSEDLGEGAKNVQNLGRKDVASTVPRRGTSAVLSGAATSEPPMSFDFRIAAKEAELRKKEFELMQQKIKLLEWENDLLRKSDNLRTVQQQPLISGASMKTVSELIPEFDGAGDLVTSWLNQVKAIRDNYAPNEITLRMAIITRLKGRASRWLHSKPQHLELTVDELFTEIEDMFKTRESSLHLRRKFESRIWRFDEAFSEYYHEKTILANQAGIPESEMLDYLIEGLKDVFLESQAKMQRFRNGQEMFTAFKNIQKQRHFKNVSGLSSQKVNFSKGSDPVLDKTAGADKSATSARCYNCNERGHISFQCTKPKRARGSCFQCGSTGHSFSVCPLRVKRSMHTAGGESSKAVCLVNYKEGYFVDTELQYGSWSGIKFRSLVDTGSPVSLIRDSLVKSIILENNVEHFYGINNSLLTTLGLFTGRIMVCDCNFILKFRVVPDTALQHDCILGRDFISYPGTKVIFGECIKVIQEDTNVEQDNDFITELNHINYVGDDEQLTIEPQIGKVDHVSKTKFLNLFEKCYVKSETPTKSAIYCEMSIKTLSEKPFYYTPRRLSFSEKLHVDNIIEDLLRQNIIRKSNSPYASRIVLVPKKNNTFRLCVDFRELNKITVKDRYPLPLIEDQLDKLKGKKFFSALDLKNGFHQITLSEDSRKYTSFVTPNGQFEYLKMPFGLCNAPAVFQRFLNEVFEDLLKTDSVLIYLDDILVVTENLKDHFEILEQVLSTLKANCLELQLTKCRFLLSEITYLGYLVDHNGISPSLDHIKAIKEYPVPRSIHEVQRFVGLVSYFRKFVLNFAVLAKPLYDMLKTSAKFLWNEKELGAFELLKEKIICGPVLSIYSPKLETELHCDASAHGFGSILLQKQLDGTFHPVMYFSKRTTEPESKYHSFELETLAIIYSLKRFHVYLQGIHFRIVTDCNSLRLTLNKKDICPRISRWALILQNYDYEVIHREGTRMQHVDALSRCYVFSVEEGHAEKTLALAQLKDENIIKIRTDLEENESSLWELRNGLVYRKDKDRLLFYVPFAMRHNVVRSCHDDMGHVGMDKTIEVIKQTYWFPQIRDFVKDYILNCIKCITYSPIDAKRVDYLQNIDKGTSPFDTIHIDHYGPLEETNARNKHIFLVLDAFTRFIKVYATKSVNANEVVKHLQDYFKNYSVPRRVISDRGSAFTSSMFSDFVNEYGIKHVLIATACPRANGAVERMNRFLRPVLAKITDDSNNPWDKVLANVEYVFNNTYCRSIDATPAKLLFGMNQRQNREIDFFKDLLSNVQARICIEEIRNRAIKRNQEVQSYNRVYYDRKCKKLANDFQEGDFVVIRNVSYGGSKKLAPKFKGPYFVKKELPNRRYLVADIDGFQLSQIPFEGVFDALNMKMWLPRLTKQIQQNNDNLDENKETKLNDFF